MGRKIHLARFFEHFLIDPGINIRPNECLTTDRLHGICMPIAYCFNQFDNMRAIQMNFCLRDDTDPGVCCPRFGLEREPSLKKSKRVHSFFKLSYCFALSSNKNTQDQNEN